MHLASLILRHGTECNTNSLNGLELRVICANADGVITANGSCAPTLGRARRKKKKKCQLCPPSLNKQVAHTLPLGLSVCFSIVLVFLWRRCRTREERRHAVHLHARAAVLSSWLRSPDELPFGGGQGGTWKEKRQLAFQLKKKKKKVHWKTTC